MSQSIRLRISEGFRHGNGNVAPARIVGVVIIAVFVVGLLISIG